MHRIRTTAALAASAFALAAGGAHAAPTDIDTGFGTNGKAVVENGRDEITEDVVVQPDGKTIGVGYTSTPTTNLDALVFRLNADGSPDQGFGLRAVDYQASHERATAVALQPDGKIVVAGLTFKNNDVFVFRLDQNGELDQSFGNGGRATIDSGGTERAEDVAVAPDGKIVVVGSTSVGDDAAVYRLDAQGKPDNTFDGDGARGISQGARDYADAVAVQADGKIVVTGFFGTGGLSVYRLNENGSLDTSFDGGIARAGTGYIYGYDVAIQPDGKVVAVAEGSGPKDDAILVARFTTAGKLDPAFRDTGTTLVDTNSDDLPSSLTIQPDGKLLIGGGVEAGEDALLARLNGDGSRDAGFGESGVFTFSRGGLDSDAVSALAPDGKIVLAGDDSATETDAIVFRFLGDSTPPGGGGGPGPGPGDGGQTPPPPPPPAATFGPDTKVTLTSVRPRGRRTLVVRVANANAFAVTGRVSAGRAAKARRFTVAASGRTTVRLRLKAALRGKRRLRLTALVRDPAGTSRTVAKRVVVRVR